MQVDAGTYGALLLGALFASGYVVGAYIVFYAHKNIPLYRLSGVFGVQCLLYFKCYPKDKKALKALVRHGLLPQLNALFDNLFHS